MPKVCRLTKQTVTHVIHAGNDDEEHIANNDPNDNEDGRRIKGLILGRHLFRGFQLDKEGRRRRVGLGCEMRTICVVGRETTRGDFAILHSHSECARETKRGSATHHHVREAFGYNVAVCDNKVDVAVVHGAFLHG